MADQSSEWDMFDLEDSQGIERVSLPKRKEQSREETKTHLKVPKAKSKVKNPRQHTTQWPLGDQPPEESRWPRDKKYPPNAPTDVGLSSPGSSFKSGFESGFDDFDDFDDSGSKSGSRLRSRSNERPEGHETQALSADELTAPQTERMAEHITRRMESGELPEGNVELAAMLGHKPAIKALGRHPDMGMEPLELIKFLLTDPYVKITVSDQHGD